MSSIFAKINNYSNSKWEIVGITDDEVLVQAVMCEYCPNCGHLMHISHGPIRHIPRKKYDSFTERLSKFFDKFIK